MRNFSAALAALPAAALAHDGHALSGTHWHASDVLGFVLAGVVVAAALWWTGRR